MNDERFFFEMAKPSCSSFTILDTERFREVHQATMIVLERTGIRVDSATARDLLADHGCHVDAESKRVRFPASIVTKAIASAPGKVLLSGRDASRDIILGSGRSSFANFSSNINFVDPESGARVKSTKRDLACATRLCDALKEIDVYTRAVYPLDVPERLMHLHTAETCLKNTTKHSIHGPESAWETRQIIRMAEAAVGGKDILKERKPVSFVSSVISPLRLSRSFCEVIMTSADAGFPTIIASAAMGGGTAPIHLAGLLVQTNAEILSGIILAQMVNPGVPVIYASYSTGMDLRFASSPLGSPEAALMASSVSGLCQYYRIPCQVPGISTDSKKHGIQAAFEKALTGLAASMAGASLVCGIGGVETGLTFDPALAVLDDEMVGLIRYFNRGIEVNPETLSTEIIREVGVSGSFLTHSSTFSHMRSGTNPRLFNRYNRDLWEKHGSPGSYEKALETAKAILVDYRPQPLSDSASKAIECIIAEAEATTG
jgi:trimethylamine--corrinoid protein Co-methyltransferase